MHKDCNNWYSYMVGELEVQRAPSDERVLVAPVELDLNSRLDFRRDALRCVESLRRGAGRLVIDMTATRSVDSTGLGVLFMVRRRAAQRRQQVVLRGVSEELRLLLVLTKLEGLFEIEMAPTH
ncbi:MAG: STAS domain-containing protein [Gemmatimonadota bacterium]|nr:MAG: STAS domain-containing protein [Gemmatimonadota bacterium]